MAGSYPSPATTNYYGNTPFQNVIAAPNGSSTTGLNRLNRYPNTNSFAFAESMDSAHSSNNRMLPASFAFPLPGIHAVAPSSRDANDKVSSANDLSSKKVGLPQYFASGSGDVSNAKIYATLGNVSASSIARSETNCCHGPTELESLFSNAPTSANRSASSSSSSASLWMQQQMAMSSTAASPNVVSPSAPVTGLLSPAYNNNNYKEVSSSPYYTIQSQQQSVASAHQPFSSSLRSTPSTLFASNHFPGFSSPTAPSLTSSNNSLQTSPDPAYSSLLFSSKMPQVKTEPLNDVFGDLQENRGGKSAAPGAKRRGIGGRRPKEDNMSWMTPEEQQKRNQRRERNKQAAARCRQRRLEKITTLQDQVDELTASQDHMRNNIADLERIKADLEQKLMSHNCKCGGVQFPAGLGNVVASSNGNNNTSNANSRPVTVSPQKRRLVKVTATTHGNVSFVVPTSASIGGSFDSSPSSEPAAKRPNTLGLVGGGGDANGNGSLQTPGIPTETPSRGVLYTYDPLLSNLLEGPSGLTPVSMGLTPLLTSTCSGATLSLDTPTVGTVAEMMAVSSASSNSTAVNHKALLQL